MRVGILYLYVPSIMSSAMYLVPSVWSGYLPFWMSTPWWQRKEKTWTKKA